MTHLRHNLVAYLALLIALGGTSYAAVKLPPNSVGTSQIKANAVTSKKVRNGTLKKADFKAGQLPPAGPTGPAGPAGPAGAVGPAGAPGEDFAYARTIVVNDTQDLETVVDGINDASASKKYLVKLEPGSYIIGADTLNVDAHIDIEGSGAGATRLVWTGNVDTGLQKSGPGEVRQLAIDFSSSGTSQPVAVSAESSTVRDVTITATATASAVTGILPYGTDTVVRDVIVNAKGTAPTNGGATALAFGNPDATVTVFNSILRAEAQLDSDDDASGLNVSGTLRVVNSIISAKIHIAGQIARGLTAQPTSKVTITGSEIIASTDGAGTVIAVTEVTTGVLKIAHSVLAGTSSGSPACVSTFSDDYVTARSATCS